MEHPARPHPPRPTDSVRAVAVPWRSLAVRAASIAVREVPRLLAARASQSGASARAGRSLVYAPEPDGRADPGEVVWTWVAYEDDPGRGKDRPVLVVGREGAALLALVLSSQDERDGQRGWLALGPGAWDREQRPSWVRLDRVLRVAEDGIRREGAVLDRARFDRVARALRSDHGWS